MDCIDYIFQEKSCGCKKNFSEVPCCGSLEQQKPIFSQLIEQTRQCLDTHTGDPIECETAYLSEKNEFTYHTHPNGTRQPSDVDINTTKKLNKDYLCIGMVPTGEIVCWSKEDGFKEEVCSF